MKKIDVLNVDVVSEDYLKHRLSKESFWSMLDIDCTQGDCNGDGCPINYGNETTEISQNYGCLPDPVQIIKMRALEGLTWGCHDNPDKPCVSGVKLLKSLGLPYKVLELQKVW